MRILIKVFLRLYAANLRRTWRQAQGTAWSDAIFTMDSLVGIPVLSSIYAMWMFLMALFPTSIGVLGIPRGAVVVLVLMIGFIIDRLLTRGVSRYKNESITSDSYSTTADSMAIIAAFLISFTYFLIMIAIVVAIHKTLRT
jgi:uncharacterized membrane protein